MTTTLLVLSLFESLPPAAEVTALLSAIFLGIAKLWSTFLAWRAKRLETTAQQTIQTLGTTAKMEDINTERTKTLFEMYQRTIERLECENTALKQALEELQRQVIDLTSEVHKLRLENRTFRSVVENMRGGKDGNLGESFLSPP